MESRAAVSKRGGDLIRYLKARLQLLCGCLTWHPHHSVAMEQGTEVGWGQVSLQWDCQCPEVPKITSLDVDDEKSHSSLCIFISLLCTYPPRSLESKLRNHILPSTYHRAWCTGGATYMYLVLFKIKVTERRSLDI